MESFFVFVLSGLSVSMVENFYLNDHRKSFLVFVLSGLSVSMVEKFYLNDHRYITNYKGLYIFCSSHCSYGHITWNCQYQWPTTLKEWGW
ncbi:hypothetical protein CR513_59444, partial [Mucuna pruriens]